MSKNNTLTYRVGVLEKNYEKLDVKIDSLLENHLPTLEKQVVSLRTEIRILTLFNIGAIILSKLL